MIEACKFGHVTLSSMLETAAAIRRGEVTATQVTQETLERIERDNDAIGAFTTVDAERATQVAESIGADDPRPLAGVPVALKDFWSSRAGAQQALGSTFFVDRVANFTTEAVARLERAGAVVVGTTNVPEMGLLPFTNSRLWGPARNPWDHEITAGGSSGGAGAAVAAGMVPFALGDDAGGSVRIPAAACGLVGLSPSRGRIPRGPEYPDDPLGTYGPLTRTVADALAGFQVLAGLPVDTSQLEAPTRPLRIAVTIDAPNGTEVAEECIAAVEHTAATLVDFGHEIVRAAPAWPDADFMRARRITVAAHSIGAAAEIEFQRTGRRPGPDDLEPYTWDTYELARSTSAADYGAAQVTLRDGARQLGEFFGDIDVLLTPTLATAPPRIDDVGPHLTPTEVIDLAGRLIPFLSCWNATRQPSLSIPGVTDSLPVGVLLVGRSGEDEVLLRIARDLERIDPWKRTPDGV